MMQTPLYENLTHWPLGDLIEVLDKYVNFRADFSVWYLGYFLSNCTQANVTGPYWWEITTGLGSGLVPSAVT